MPETRSATEIEQLRAMVLELKKQLSAKSDDRPEYELEELRAELAELRSQVVGGSSRDGDAFRLPDPFKYLSEFSGNKKELSAWLEEIQEIYEDFKVKNQTGGYSLNSLYIRAIKNKVKGEARTLLCANGNPNTIEGIKKILLEHYGDEKDFTTNLSTLFHVRKGDKSHIKFYNDIRELNTKLKANLQSKPLSGHEIIEILTIARYLDNIQEPLGSIIRNSKPKNLEEAHQAVLLNLNAESRLHRQKPSGPPGQKQPTKYFNKNNNDPDKQGGDSGKTRNTPHKQNSFKRQQFKPQPRAEANNNEVEEVEEAEPDTPTEDDDNLEYSDEELNFQTARKTNPVT